MGKRGPAKRPQELKDLDGNPEKRPRSKPSVKAIGNVRKPRYLTESGSLVWSELIASMPPGFFTQADNHILAAYCMAVDLMRQAIADIEENGIVVFNGAHYAEDGQVLRTGTKARNPASAVLSDAQAKIATLGTKLGLDPTSRESIGINAGGEDDDDGEGFGDLIAITGGKKTA